MATCDCYSIKDGKKVYHADYTDSIHDIAEVASMFCSLTMEQLEAILTAYIMALIDGNPPTPPSTLGLDVFDIATDYGEGGGR